MSTDHRSIPLGCVCLFDLFYGRGEVKTLMNCGEGGGLRVEIDIGMDSFSLGRVETYFL